MGDAEGADDATARRLVQNSTDGLSAVDTEHRYTLWNPAMERFSGKSAAEVLGKNMFEVFPFLRQQGLDEAVARALAGEVVLTTGVPYVAPNGAIYHFERRFAPLRNDAGAITGAVGVVSDVTARHIAEEALQSSEHKLRLALEAANIGLWSWDAETDEVTWDDRMRAIFGLSPGRAPVTREAYLAMVHPEDREATRASRMSGAEEGRGWEGEHRILRADGSVRWVLAKGAVTEREGRRVVFGATLDATERHEREERLRQAQKLEAVGQLTAGIAHNFNNILMALLPNLSLAASAAPPELVPLLTSAAEAATRASDLVRRLMTFAGQNRPAARLVQPIGALVARTVSFCRSTVDPHIAIDGDYDDAASASVDAAQLEQALVNLVLNARDALLLAEATEPRIAIRVEVVPQGHVELAGRAGDHVRIRVTDNGVGLDAATAARAFEPFFTTKEVGKGTGLGLATTRTIVHEHGGFITCDAEPGSGATFSVYLPQIRSERPPPRAAGAAEGREGEKTRTGTETVLVVDDEAAVRTVIARMLRAGGYTVKLA